MFRAIVGGFPATNETINGSDINNSAILLLFIIGKACLMAINGAICMILMRSSNFSVGNSSIGETCCMPALLINMSNEPK